MLLESRKHRKKNSKAVCFRIYAKTNGFSVGIGIFPALQAKIPLTDRRKFYESDCL
jgi:hypothetical protein